MGWSSVVIQSEIEATESENVVPLLNSSGLMHAPRDFVEMFRLGETRVKFFMALVERFEFLFVYKHE